MRNALVGVALAAVAALGLALPSLDHAPLKAVESAPVGAHVYPGAVLDMAQIDDLRTPSLTCPGDYYADLNYAGDVILTCAPTHIQGA